MKSLKNMKFCIWKVNKQGKSQFLFFLISTWEYSRELEDWNNSWSLMI